MQTNNSNKNDNDNTNIPIRHLWKCILPAWNDVTTSTIRNCFANSPSIPNDMQRHLATKPDKDTGIANLKQKLSTMYPSLEGDIAKQNNYHALIYLEAIYSKEPRMQEIDQLIRFVKAHPEFKDRYEESPLEEEDELDEEEEIDDPDFDVATVDASEDRANNSESEVHSLNSSPSNYQYNKPLSPINITLRSGRHTGPQQRTNTTLISVTPPRRLNLPHKTPAEFLHDIPFVDLYNVVNNLEKNSCLSPQSRRHAEHLLGAIAQSVNEFVDYGQLKETLTPTEQQDQMSYEQDRCKLLERERQAFAEEAVSFLPHQNHHSTVSDPRDMEDMEDMESEEVDDGLCVINNDNTPVSMVDVRTSRGQDEGGLNIGLLPRKE
ncbi:hypothetical protein BGZ81_006048 [Podila clonocystis]|nr:hypothetical protein BGZ81_006048 [Podila clonocystis]